VFEADGADVLQPLIEDGAASTIGTVEELVASLHSKNRQGVDRDHFFKPNAVDNVIDELKNIQ
jgi:hypothetical protein